MGMGTGDQDSADGVGNEWNKNKKQDNRGSFAPLRRFPEGNDRKKSRKKGNGRNRLGGDRVGDSMRIAGWVAGVALLAGSVAGFAETKIPCGKSLDHALESRSVLMIDSKPAGLHIVGTDEDAIHVSCTGANDETARNVTIQFSPTAKGGKLTIQGPHLQHGNNGLEIKIEVPRRTSLSVRMFAGEVTVEGVKGDKDIEVGAGQITISSIHDGDYRSVNATVDIGEVNARAFGDDKGGFFRSFTKENSSGDYRLRAHVTTGEIDLLGNAGQKGDGARPD